MGVCEPAKSGAEIGLGVRLERLLHDCMAGIPSWSKDCINSAGQLALLASASNPTGNFIEGDAEATDVAVLKVEVIEVGVEEP